MVGFNLTQQYKVIIVHANGQSIGEKMRENKCLMSYWMYKTIIRPVVLYGSEAWCLMANDEKNLRIWERNVLRKIFGPICVVGYWRSRTNEVRQLYGELDIVTEIKKEDLDGWDVWRG